MDWQRRIIEQVDLPIGDLTENPENWRKHPRAQAQALGGMLAEVGCSHVLVGHSERRQYQREDEDAFVATLRRRRIPVSVRDTRGQEIDGACGQLAAAD